MRACVTFVVVAAAAIGAAVARDTFPPLFPASNTVPRCADPSLQDIHLYYTKLEASTQMPAQEVTLRVGVPFDNLTAFFNQSTLWTTWNRLFASNTVTNYTVCAPFNNVTYSNGPRVSPPFPANLQAPHFIDQHGYNADGTEFAFGWNFQLTTGGVMIVFGRHTFTLRPLVDQSRVPASIVTHFEKAAGPQLETRVNQVAWTVALQESLLDTVNGFVCLERVWTSTGALDAAAVRETCYNFKP